MANLRQYETTYILRPNLEEADRTKTMERITGVIATFEGNIARTDEWGTRKLAYPIRKETRGEYIYMHYEAPAKTILELERVMRLMDPVIKFLTVRLDAQSVEMISPWEVQSKDDENNNDE